MKIEEIQAIFDASEDAINRLIDAKRELEARNESLSALNAELVEALKAVHAIATARSDAQSRSSDSNIWLNVADFVGAAIAKAERNASETL